MSTDTYSEEHRFRCEVRTILVWAVTRPRGTVKAYLDAVERRRGKESRERLEFEYRRQYTLGNRGKAGDWREQSDAFLETVGG